MLLGFSLPWGRGESQGPTPGMAALQLPWQSTQPGHPSAFLLFQSKMLLPFL